MFVFWNLLFQIGEHSSLNYLKLPSKVKEELDLVAKYNTLPSTRFTYSLIVCLLDQN